MVAEGDKLQVNRIEGEEGKKIVSEEVMLLVDEESVKIGKPIVEKAKVELKILKSFLGEKIRVAKFKAKTGYRRVRGFRPSLTLLQVEKITP